MKIYQILKVTKEGKYLVRTTLVLKSATDRAKKTVAYKDIAPAEYQRLLKRKLEDGCSPVSIRLTHHGCAIDVEIWKL